MNRGVEIIVLHTTRFGENSLVVHTLSKEYGRRGFLVRGVGKKSAASLFLPLNVLEGEVVESSKSDLYSIRGLSSKYALMGIRGDMCKNAISMFISEVVFRIVKEGTMEGGMKEWLEKKILVLDALKSDFSNFHVRFLFELAVMLGFSPRREDLLPFAGENLEIIGRFLDSDFESAMLIPLSGKLRSEICTTMLRYIEYHSDSKINIRSLAVLGELFQ